ncbi:MAG TPA: PP2C family protein-serine/threonine phosphatase [Candidatus Limnocylindrales bacterium]|nr:PP2C family protein-serine/threonine phosphatase [Candidatus Limnocylindrales bacterium]
MSPTQTSDKLPGESAPENPAAGGKQRKHRLRDFWRRVTEGLELSDLWGQFAREAREGYGLYSREVDWDAVRSAKRWKRPYRAAKALFWAMILKLSPARRVLLVIALLLLVVSTFGSNSGDRDQGFVGFKASVLAAVIMFVLLALELADRVTMKRDLQIAREIQSWLVPAEAPVTPGYEIAFTTRPANTVSGDYYDAFWRSTAGPGVRDEETPLGRKLLLVVADVAGKSVPAALLMATLQASLHALAEVPSTLEQLIARLDQYVCAHSSEGRRFTTAFLAELDVTTREMRYVNAGHNAPILRRMSGMIERLDRGGLPLGVDPSRTYESGSTTLKSGDALFVFTDGVVEAVNDSGEEFSEMRLLQIVGNFVPASAAELRDRAMGAVEAFVGDARQHDDITCLVLRVLPTPS